MSKTETPTIPTNPEELAEILADDKKVKALFNASEEDRKDFFVAYNKIVNKGEAITSQVTEQVSAKVIAPLGFTLTCRKHSLEMTNNLTHSYFVDLQFS